MNWAHCDHRDSMHVRCTDCGTTWRMQASEGPLASLDTYECPDRSAIVIGDVVTTCVEHDRLAEKQHGHVDLRWTDEAPGVTVV